MTHRIKGLLSEYKFLYFVFSIEILFILWALVLLFQKSPHIILNPADCVLQDAACPPDEDGSLAIVQDNFTIGADTVIGAYPDIFLRPGAYMISVDYTAELVGYDYSSWTGGSNIVMCSVNVSSDKIPLQIIGNDISMTMDGFNNEQPFWINSLTNCKDLKIRVTYHGYGNVHIRQIDIKEQLVFRFTRLFVVMLFVTVINLFIYVFFMDNKIKNKEIIVGLTAVILFSNLPIFFRMLFFGYDLNFHLARIAEIVQGIYSGNWLIKIQPDMINGYGYATPIFYPQLFLYIPAILYIVGFPLQTSYQIFVFLTNASTCLICYYCFKKITGDKRISLIGSSLYTLSIFRVMNVYLDAMVGQYLAMMFFPLVIYGIYIIYASDKKVSSWKHILPPPLNIWGKRRFAEPHYILPVYGSLPAYIRAVTL